MALSFAAKLKELRRANNIKRDELASMIHVSPSTIANYEQGTREPNFETLAKLAKAFNITLDEMVGYRRRISPKPYFINGNECHERNTERYFGLYISQFQDEALDQMHESPPRTKANFCVELEELLEKYKK